MTRNCDADGEAGGVVGQGGSGGVRRGRAGGGGGGERERERERERAGWRAGRVAGNLSTNYYVGSIMIYCTIRFSLECTMLCYVLVLL